MQKSLFDSIHSQAPFPVNLYYLRGPSTSETMQSLAGEMRDYVTPQKSLEIADKALHCLQLSGSERFANCIIQTRLFRAGVAKPDLLKAGKIMLHHVKQELALRSLLNTDTTINDEKIVSSSPSMRSPTSQKSTPPMHSEPEASKNEMSYDCSDRKTASMEELSPCTADTNQSTLNGTGEFSSSSKHTICSTQATGGSISVIDSGDLANRIPQYSIYLNDEISVAESLGIDSTAEDAEEQKKSIQEKVQEVDPKLIKELFGVVLTFRGKASVRVMRKLQETSSDLGIEQQPYSKRRRIRPKRAAKKILASSK